MEFFYDSKTEHFPTDIKMAEILKKISVDLIYLNFQKAFHKIPHKQLLIQSRSSRYI